MPGTTPPTSQLEWFSSTTAMIVLFWSRATRDLLKSFGWGIAALHRYCSDKVAIPRRPPHSVSRSHPRERVSFGDKIYPDTEGHVMADERSAATMLEEI